MRAGFIVFPGLPGALHCMRGSAWVEMVGDDQSASDAVS